MNAITPHRRTVLLTLSLAQIGDRVVIKGTRPDPATVRLATILRSAGIHAQLNPGTGPRTVGGLARGLAARDPDAILVRVADESLLELVGVWIGALRTECPGARIILLSDSENAHGLDVDACLPVDDHAALLVQLSPCTSALWDMRDGYLQERDAPDRADRRQGKRGERRAGTTHRQDRGRSTKDTSRGQSRGRSTEARGALAGAAAGSRAGR